MQQHILEQRLHQTTALRMSCLATLRLRLPLSPSIDATSTPLWHMDVVSAIGLAASSLQLASFAFTSWAQSYPTRQRPQGCASQAAGLPGGRRKVGSATIRLAVDAHRSEPGAGVFPQPTPTIHTGSVESSPAWDWNTRTRLFIIRDVRWRSTPSSRGHIPCRYLSFPCYHGPSLLRSA